MLDLHIHLAMYLRPPGLGAAARQRMIDVAGRDSGNFLADGRPRASVAALRRGGVQAAASVLYSPFDEIAPRPRDLVRARLALSTLATVRRQGSAPSGGAAASLAAGALVAARPPNPGAFRRLLAHLEAMERHVVRHHASQAAYVHSPAELEDVAAGGRLALVHAVEGGFHLPPDPHKAAGAVAELARRGVAYLTVAHLAHRAVATVAPAIPYLPDDVFHELFPQPKAGLSERGRAIVAAAVRAGLPLDVSHMSERSLQETFALLDRLDPDREAGVLASHVAFRFGTQAYNLPDWAIREIAARGGVVGLIAARHQLADGAPAPASFDEGLELLFRHVDAIADVTGGHEHTAIGTDLGGFIEPLPGVDDVGCLAAVAGALERRYGSDDGVRIASGNARRLLAEHWGRRPAVSPRA